MQCMVAPLHCSLLLKLLLQLQVLKLLQIQTPLPHVRSWDICMHMSIVSRLSLNEI